MNWMNRLDNVSSPTIRMVGDVESHMSLLYKMIFYARHLSIGIS